MLPCFPPLEGDVVMWARRRLRRFWDWVDGGRSLTPFLIVAGLRGLAVQLLALAGEDVPAGYHGDLHEGIELDSGSAGLTVMRT
jgi:hypothetical protein